MGFPNSGAIEAAPLDTEQIQVMAVEIYGVAIGRTGFLRCRWLIRIGRAAAARRCL